MKGKNITQVEGCVYVAEDQKRGALSCAGCVAQGDGCYDRKLCEALLPCSIVNRADQRSVIWRKATAAEAVDYLRQTNKITIEHGTATIKPDVIEKLRQPLRYGIDPAAKAVGVSDEFVLIKGLVSRIGVPNIQVRVIPNGQTCTALVLRPKRWLLWPEDNCHADHILCDSCCAKLQELWDRTGVDYNIEPMPGYFGCQCCGVGHAAHVTQRFKFLLEDVL